MLAAVLLAGCASLPPLDARVASHYVAATSDTRLGKAIVPLVAAHPGLSGVAALANARDAFAARATLAAAAERSLDVQYYIWHADTTGQLLFDALRAAADRGVRVRLLLDDNNTAGMDAILAALDADPHIEVRLFNPFPQRGSRLLGYAGDFSRLNRRMHNKSFTADNQATIIGGRNVGDEYFDADGDVLFADLDVLAVGPVVEAVSRDFDRYWNSASAYPLQMLLPPGAAATPAAGAGQAGSHGRPGVAQAYLAAIRDSPFVAQLVEQRLPMEWTRASLLSDDPAKVLGEVSEASKVSSQLTSAMGTPQRRIDLVSPYFVPGKQWSGRFSAMARTGVEVFILTNSLEATDVAAVHAGYAKWRKSMLEGGVTLYELKRASGVQQAGVDTDKNAGRSAAGGVGKSVDAHTRGKAAVGGSGGVHAVGSSSSSLHAKTFAVDGERLFIGSFNFDPRSADLNTEMGFVIDSPAMASRMALALREQVPSRAYKVELDKEGTLHWIEQTPEGPKRHDTEPGTGFWRRAAVGLLSLLPIDWLL